MKITTPGIVAFFSLFTSLCAAQSGNSVMTNPPGDQLIQQPVGTKLQVNGTMWVGQFINGTAMIDAHDGLAYFGDNLPTNGLAVHPAGNVDIGSHDYPAYHELSIIDYSDNEVGQNIVNADPTGYTALRMGAYGAEGVGLSLFQFNDGWVFDAGSAFAPSSSTLATSSSNGLSFVTASASPIRLFTSGLYGPNERMRVDASGNVGIGTTSPGATVRALPNPPSAATPIFEVNGAIALTPGQGGAIYFSDGTVQSTAYAGASCSANGGDYAESVDVTGSRTDYEPGDVLVLGTTADVAKSSEPYSTLVAGIYSTRPGYVGRRQPGTVAESVTAVPMAMVGIVPTKVTAENGPIRRGDLLVTSSVAGYAMKGTDRQRMMGAIVGKAMGTLDRDIGIIEVLVSLQ